MRVIWKQILLLYAALLIGQLIFGLLMVYMLVAVLPAEAATVSYQYPLLAFSIVVIGIVLSLYFNNLRTEHAQKLQLPLASKVLHYRTTVLMRVAILQSGNLFCLLLILLTQSYYPFLFFAIGLLAFVRLRPSLDDVIDTYKLSAQEAAQLRKM